MKIRDIIQEASVGKIPKRVQRATRGLHKFTDGDHWNSDYTQYRLGLALASTDGKTEPNVDKESWVGKWKTAHPYTKEEHDMFEKAYKAVNADYTDMNHGDNESQEGPTINKQSIVAARKKNKYGI
jgi:hypothetical protein